MNIFGKVGDSITSTSKGVADKAKSVSEMSKIRKQIIYEEEKLNKRFYEIGEKYYEENSDNPNAKYYDIMASIREIKERTERLKFEVNSIRGVKVCPGCGAEITNDFLFCGICGTKLPEPPAEPEPIKVEAEIVKKSDKKDTAPSPKIIESAV